MNGQELKRFLWEKGHFANPEMPTGVKQHEVDTLSLASDEVKTAIRSYQDFMRYDFDRLVLEEHGRRGIADGDPGPATRRLFEMERCGCPDFDPNAEAATGRGSWPAGCWDEYPNHHAFGVHFDFSGMPSFLDGVFKESWELCKKAYRDIGIAFFETDDARECNTNVTWTRGRGWIGLAIVPSNPRCGDRIWAKFDDRYQPRAMVDQWARLLAHEFGHNMGMSHSRGGIMNPSITSGAFTPNAWRGDPSEPILTRYFGGEPVPGDEPEPEPPTDPPADVDLVFRGSFTAQYKGEDVGEYILVPKPRV